MSAQSKQIDLEEKLDLMAATQLLKDLKAHEDKPMRLDASHVSHIDLPCLQLLISAKEHWHRNDLAFSIDPISEKFEENLTTLGLTSSIFENLEQ